MATFLNAAETSAAIERIIVQADREVTLISAYVYPRVIHVQRLMEASGRGVRIVLVFGKRQLDAKVETELVKIPNLVVYYLNNLHAKCYLNEREAVITSMNLLNSPKADNWEMGVLLGRTSDGEAFKAATLEVASIINVAEHVHGAEREAPANTASRLPDKGYCIRCGTDIRFEPYAPLCHGDWSTWMLFQNNEFPEKHCHWCGKSRRVSKGTPLCMDCVGVYERISGKPLDLSRKWG